METVTISHFKATCLALIAKVNRTKQPILITKRGQPVAQVAPPPQPDNRNWLGCMAGTVKILGDIVNPDPEMEKLWYGDEEEPQN